jgi:hypothetical protein
VISAETKIHSLLKACSLTPTHLDIREDSVSQRLHRFKKEWSSGALGLECLIVTPIYPAFRSRRSPPRSHTGKREEIAEFVAFLKVWLSSDFNSPPFDKPVVLSFDGGREYKIPPSEYMLARRARVVGIRQVLKYAIEEDHIKALPIIPRVGKIEPSPRPWLTRAEFDHLRRVSLERIATAENPRVARQRQDLHDFIVCMVESTARVSELRNLTVGHVKIEKYPFNGEPYATLTIQGKTGHRVAIAGGKFPAVFERRAANLKAGDLLWPHTQRDAFRELLDAAGLRRDAFGVLRNLKSVRATAISLRILSQAPSPDLIMIARNAGTSVAMIDAFYARRLSAEMAAERLSRSVI